MKKLQNLKEWQIVGIFSALGASVAYASVVAIFAHTLDLLPVMTLCAVLVGITAVAVGVTVGMVKDEQIARIVRGYRALNAECSDSARTIGELRDTNRALVAQLANARERLAESGSDLVEHQQADKYADKLHTFTNAVYHFGWALIEDYDLFESAKYALLGIHGKNLTETASAQVFRDYVLDIYADDDAPTPTDYTHSASTALLIGTLDRAYEVNGETRYPLA